MYALVEFLFGGVNIMRIENVDWQLTSRCNRMCPYCFGPADINDLPLSDVKSIVDTLTKMGVKQIGLTGGEPLLYPHIAELIEYIVDNGIHIYLSSNCDYYSEFARLIKEKVSILGVPLDGASAVTHDSIRGVGSFQSITSAIADISRSSCNTKVKVGIVLLNSNASELANIEKVLFPYREKILYWKIYELIIYSKNRATATPLQTPYVCGQHDLGQYVGAQKIVFDTIEERDRSYFFIKPNGDVFIPCLNHHESSEKDIGTILGGNIENTVRTFDEIVNRSGYNKEFRYMKNPNGR